MDRLPKHFVHGKMIAKRLKDEKFLKKNRAFVERLIQRYCEWHLRNKNDLLGYDEGILSERANLFNDYKNFLDRNIHSSAQTKLHSSALEEFLYYLFRDYIIERDRKGIMNLGGAKAYTNLYFSPRSFEDFIENTRMKINSKDQDFAIYKTVDIRADSEKKKINIPVVSIECKTYIDKTMLEGSIATAEKIKNGNPYSLFIVVSEFYDVSFDVDPKYSRIDQIFVLRKQKRPKEKGEVYPIDPDVVIHLFNFVRQHIERPWSDVERKMKDRGTII